MQKFSNNSLSSRRALMIISRKTCEAIRSSPRILRSVSRRATRALDFALARSLLSERHLHLTCVDQRCERDLVQTDRRALSTILKHYGRFIHSPQADEIEMSKIEVAKPQKIGFGHLSLSQKCPDFLDFMAFPTGFEPGRDQQIQGFFWLKVPQSGPFRYKLDTGVQL
jgi:hypothetical protein